MVVDTQALLAGTKPENLSSSASKGGLSAEAALEHSRHYWFHVWRQDAPRGDGLLESPPLEAACSDPVVHASLGTFVRGIKTALQTPPLAIRAGHLDSLELNVSKAHTLVVRYHEQITWVSPGLRGLFAKLESSGATSGSLGYAGAGSLPAPMIKGDGQLVVSYTVFSDDTDMASDAGVDPGSLAGAHAKRRRCLTLTMDQTEAEANAISEARVTEADAEAAAAAAEAEVTKSPTSPAPASPSAGGGAVGEVTATPPAHPQGAGGGDDDLPSFLEEMGPGADDQHQQQPPQAQQQTDTHTQQSTQLERP